MEDAEYKGSLVGSRSGSSGCFECTPFDVEDVELKGTPMAVMGQRRGEVRGRDLRVPGEDAQGLEGFAEWESTTRMTVHELRALPERFAVPEPEP